MTEFGPLHRIELMLGAERVERLRQSYVVLAGLGAVGGFTLEALARAGIGAMRLIDCDTIKPSNLNRQLLADRETIGRKKTLVAAERIARINPDCRVETLDLLINAASIPEVFTFPERSPDLIIDAIDSLGPKVDLIAAAVERGIPVFSSMGAALRTDLTQIHFGRLTEVTHCPLSAMLRKRLRRRGVDTDAILCVWSSEPVRAETRSGPLSGAYLAPEDSEDEKPEQGRRRSTLGSLPTIPPVFGLYLAHEAIRQLAGREARPRGSAPFLRPTGSAPFLRFRAESK